MSEDIFSPLFSDSWSEKQKENFRYQVERFDVTDVERQRKLIRSGQSVKVAAFTPFTDYISPPDGEKGRKLVKEGKVACLVVAGGQGTRLGFDGPKGAFPITKIKKKSLFQRLSERALAASKNLPLAIMTSPLNHEATCEFFDNHELFGLNPEQLNFFQQKMFPFLDDKGNPFLESPGKIAAGPNGNGSALKHLVLSGVWDKWKNKGVTHVIFIQVDNALVDPFDAALLEAHVSSGNEVTVKCVRREDPQEDVGVLAKRGDDVVVVEYSEITDDERAARTNGGDLLHLCANMSVFCFNMDFIRRAVVEDALPYHLAYKKAQHLEQTIMAYKSERFIFDVLSKAKPVGAVLDERWRSFAPLKLKSSIEQVQAALCHFDQKFFQKLTQTDNVPEEIELHPSFYYLEELQRKGWLGKSWPSGRGYLTP